MHDQMAKAPPVIQGNLVGKTVVVVGANGGIGYEAARHFALMNPDRLVLACRSRERGDAALRKLQSEIGARTAELRLIDLSSFASVSTFADNFELEVGRLDILVMNAAVWPGKEYHATADGWESSLQINNLGTSLLSLRLLPLMVDTSSKPRLVIVTSDVHYFAKVDEKIAAQPGIWKNLSSKEYCTSDNMSDSRYLLTKLLNVFFVRSLAARLPARSPVVSAIHPGVCISDLRREFTGIRKCMEPVLEKLIMYTAEEGSRQLVYGALGQDGKLHGGYTTLSKVVETSDYVLSEEGRRVADRMWDELIDILSGVDGRIPAVVRDYLH
ncbi:short-chain dehydrogenase [Armillaria solidipes]|uniref:Short-chain dehydrogenase n=1 Tax=Armillaria solidipes TaxID=1076256 RepID=A0A2H3BX77_9AGAR|nr:short-chain dehydrogenase [Armillaria solidipes]